MAYSAFGIREWFRRLHGVIQALAVVTCVLSVGASTGAVRSRTLLQQNASVATAATSNLYDFITRYNLNTSQVSELDAVLWNVSQQCTQVTIRVQLDYLYSMLAYAEAASALLALPDAPSVRLLFPDSTDEMTSSVLFRSNTYYSGRGDAWIADVTTAPCQTGDCRSTGSVVSGVRVSQQLSLQGGGNDTTGSGNYSVSTDDLQDLPTELDSNAAPPDLTPGSSSSDLPGPQLLMYYRHDMFTLHNWPLPATWEDLACWAAAVNGTVDSDGDGVGDWALCLDTMRACKSGFLMMAMMAAAVQPSTQYGTFFEPESLNPLVGTVAFQQALGMFSRLANYSVPSESDPLACRPYEPAFFAGRCLLTLSFDQLRAAVSEPWVWQAAEEAEEAAEESTSVVKISSNSSSSASNGTGNGSTRGVLPVDALGVAPLPGSETMLDRGGGVMVACGAANCPNAVNATCSTEGDFSKPRTCLVNRAPLLATLSYDTVDSEYLSDVIQARLLLLGLQLNTTTLTWAEALGETVLLEGEEAAAAASSGNASSSSSSDSIATVHYSSVAEWTTVEPLVQLGYSPTEVSRFLTAYWGSLLGPDPRDRTAPGPQRNVVQELSIRGSSHFTSIYAQAAAWVLHDHVSPSVVSQWAAEEAEELLQLVAANISRLAYKYCGDIGWSGESKSDSPPAPALAPSSRGLTSHQLTVAIVVPVVAVCGAVVVVAVVVLLLRRRRWGAGGQKAAGPPGPGLGTTLILTDIQNSTVLWETLPADIMDVALRCHNEVIRGLLPAHQGYESATEGDAFILAFHTAQDAARYAVAAQEGLLAAPWPAEMLGHPDCEVVWMAPQRSDPTACLSYVNRELLSVTTRSAAGGVGVGGFHGTITGGLGPEPAASAAAAAPLHRTTPGGLGTDSSTAPASAPAATALVVATVSDKAPAPWPASAATPFLTTSAFADAGGGGGGGGGGSKDSPGRAWLRQLWYSRSEGDRAIASGGASGGAGAGATAGRRNSGERSSGGSGYARAGEGSRGRGGGGGGGGGAEVAVAVSAGEPSGVAGVARSGGSGSRGPAEILGRITRSNSFRPKSRTRLPQSPSRDAISIGGGTGTSTGGALDRVPSRTHITHLTGLTKCPSDIRSYMTDNETDVDPLAHHPHLHHPPRTASSPVTVAAPPPPLQHQLHGSDGGAAAAADVLPRIYDANGVPLPRAAALAIAASAGSAAGGGSPRGPSPLSDSGYYGEGGSSSIVGGVGASSFPSARTTLFNLSTNMAVATLTEALRHGWKRCSGTGPGGVGPCGGGGSGTAAGGGGGSGGVAAAAVAGGGGGGGGSTDGPCEGRYGSEEGEGPPLLAFRGMRVRMGIHTGADLNEVSLNKATGRTQYSGTFMTVAKAVCDAAHGGQVVLSPSTFKRLAPGCMAKSAFLLHMGEHVVSEGAEAEALYQLLPYSLACRLASFEPLRSVEYLSLGLPDAPVGRVTVAFMYVVGAQTLLAWNPVVAGEALDIFQNTVSEQLSGTDGYVVELVDGLCLAAFRSPSDALLWSLRCGRLLLSAPWSDELLEHELCEEVSLLLHGDWVSGSAGPEPGPTAPSTATLGSSSSRFQGPSFRAPTPSLAQQQRCNTLTRAAALRHKTLMRGLRLKVGMDTGFVADSINATTGRMAYRGRPMNRAARIASKTLAGQVHCSAAVWGAAAERLGLLARVGGEEEVTASSLGLQSFKGVMEKLEVLSVSYKGSALSAEEAAAVARRGAPRVSHNSSTFSSNPTVLSGLASVLSLGHSGAAVAAASTPAAAAAAGTTGTFPQLMSPLSIAAAPSGASGLGGPGGGSCHGGIVGGGGPGFGARRQAPGKSVAARYSCGGGMRWAAAAAPPSGNRLSPIVRHSTHLDLPASVSFADDISNGVGGDADVVDDGGGGGGGGGLRVQERVSNTMPIMKVSGSGGAATAAGVPDIGDIGTATLFVGPASAPLAATIASSVSLHEGTTTEQHLSRGRLRLVTSSPPIAASPRISEASPATAISVPAPDATVISDAAVVAAAGAAATGCYVMAGQAGASSASPSTAAAELLLLCRSDHVILHMNPLHDVDGNGGHSNRASAVTVDGDQEEDTREAGNGNGVGNGGFVGGCVTQGMTAAEAAPLSPVPAAVTIANAAEAAAQQPLVDAAANVTVGFNVTITARLPGSGSDPPASGTDGSGSGSKADASSNSGSGAPTPSPSSPVSGAPTPSGPSYHRDITFSRRGDDGMCIGLLPLPPPLRLQEGAPAADPGRLRGVSKGGAV